MSASDLASGFRSRPLPPYANYIDRADELVMVYCGRRAWKLAPPAQDRVASLIYPAAGKDPQEYRWPVAGKDVLVFGQDEPRMQVDYLLIELFRNGATSVYVKYRADDEDLTVYTRDGRAV